MSSRKEEERNEKIIRGLMKLPPNRRCINCNGLGPQYVCTNFWTFVCITCSGIHREFTHRVKSVSMAKFTSQEVEELQRGGNQRAREMFLKDWDTQRQRLPDGSNVDKVREFIKNVYVDRRYAGGRTSDKPPRDMQNHKNHEDDNRRASSYHSYSQSPPYEHQYEDRRYGKQTGMLTRKPGSDRGHYESKISSLVYSPGRLGEQMYEDRFANEGSGTRISDYSVSSTGDPFRSDLQSPNFQKDVGFSSPPLHPTRDILVEDVRRQTINTLPGENSKRNVNGSAHSQRTPSSSSFGSFDGNSVSLKSVNSGSLIDIVLEPEQSAVTHPTMTSLFPSFEQSSISASTASQDHPFNAIFVQPQATSSAPSIDLFADITHQHSATTPLEQKPSAVPSENEGWATFDLPHHATSVHEIKHEPPPIVPPGDGVPKGNLEALPSINNNMLWAAVQNSAAHGPFSSMANQWHGGTQVVQASTIPTSSQSWNAFDDSVGGLSQAFFENPPHRSEPHVPASLPVDQLMSSKISEGSSKDGFQRSIIEDRASVSSLPLNAVISGSSVLPLVGGTPSLHACDRKSTNPFDLPFESEMESSSMFLDMNSFKAALPNPQLSTTFLGGLTEPWFPQSSVTPYIPAVPQAYMAGQAPTSQLPNITAQGPVASLGGNPFA